MSLIRQTLLYLPAQVIAPTVQFASVLLWAYFLKPEDVGLVTTFTAIQEICYAAFFGWWAMYTLRFIGGIADSRQRLAFLKTETAALLIALIAETIALLVAIPYVVPGQALDWQFALLAAIFIGTRSLNGLAADRARAEHRITLYTLVQIIGPVAGFGVGLIAILLGHANAEMVLLGFVVAQIASLLLVVAMSDLFRAFGRPSSDVMKEAMKFGGTQSTSQMLAIAAMNVPRFAVLSLFGLAVVGKFAVGYSLGLRASSFAVALVTAGAYPLVVRKMHEEGPRAAFEQLSRNMEMVALVVTPVAFGLLAISHSVTDLLVAPGFRELTYMVLPMAAFGGLLRYLRAHTSDQVFLLSLRPEVGTLIALCDLLFAAASTWVGIKLIGPSGGAIGPMVSGLITFTLSFVLARIFFGYRSPWQSFVKIFGAGVTMALAVHALPEARSFAQLIAHVLAGAVLYSSILVLVMPRAREIIKVYLRKR